MVTNIKTVKQITYKGHTIRVISFPNDRIEDVLIDNDNDTLELSYNKMRVDEFVYGSIADAKRAINNAPVKFIDLGIDECRHDEFYNRFKNN